MISTNSCVLGFNCTVEIVLSNTHGTFCMDCNVDKVFWLYYSGFGVDLGLC